MKIDSFEYPINWKGSHIKTQKPRKKRRRRGWGSKSLRILKASDVFLILYVDIDTKYSLCEDVEKKYGKMGPNTVIYLGVIRHLFYLTAVSTIIYSTYSLNSNGEGNFCTTTGLCTQVNFIYQHSVYNIFNDPEVQYNQLILWFLVTLTILAFNLKLRYKKSHL